MDMNKKYVWYACYGSNILRKRFMLYIQGGFCKFNNRDYIPCNDTSAPLDSKPINIPHKLYFGNRSGSWEGGGVAFLEPERNENTTTLGRIYLITEEQFKEINTQEGPGWYDLVIDLGTLNGVPIKTFTFRTSASRVALMLPLFATAISFILPCIASFLKLFFKRLNPFLLILIYPLISILIIIPLIINFSHPSIQISYCIILYEFYISLHPY